MVLLDATSEQQFAPFGSHPAYFPSQAVNAVVQQLQVYSVAAYFGVARLALQTGLAPLEDFSAYPATVKPIVLAHASQTRYYSTQHDEYGGLAGKRRTSARRTSSEPVLWEASAGRAVQGRFTGPDSAGKTDGSHVGCLTAGSGLTFFQQSAQRRPAQWALHSPGSTRSRHRGYPIGLATGPVVEAQHAEAKR